MKTLAPVTLDSAPEKSKEALNKVQNAFGFIPNLIGIFGHSPAVLNGYLGMTFAWEGASLSSKERQTIAMVVSVENGCHYCECAHQTALQGLDVDSSILRAIHDQKTIPDPKLNALVQFTKELVNKRGRVSEETKSQFIHAGYNEVQIMEVIVGVALKTVSNYIEHIHPVEIDQEFNPN